MEDKIKDISDLVKLQCSNGNWNYDPYMHGMANGLILALATLTNEEPAYLEKPDKWLGKDAIEKLTELQLTLSPAYGPGPISTVAMLGLVGEAGEVLAECYHTENNFDIIQGAIQACERVDSLKKRVRKGTNDTFAFVQDASVDKFKSELADTFYYLNILATNMGLSIYDLAQMAHDKIKAKQAAGGSSEQQKQ